MPSTAPMFTAPFLAVCFFLTTGHILHADVSQECKSRAAEYARNRNKVMTTTLVYLKQSCVEPAIKRRFQNKPLPAFLDQPFEERCPTKSAQFSSEGDLMPLNDLAYFRKCLTIVIEGRD